MTTSNDKAQAVAFNQGSAAIDFHLTSKQEAFCQVIVSGMTQADAYRAAYNTDNMKDETIQKKACGLMKEGKIRGRIAELREPIIEKMQYRLEQAMQEAGDAFQVAKDKENAGAMVAAVQLRAKLNGLLIARTEDVTDPFKKAIGNMPASQAQAMIEFIEQMQAKANS